MERLLPYPCPLKLDRRITRVIEYLNLSSPAAPASNTETCQAETQQSQTCRLRNLACSARTCSTRNTGDTRKGHQNRSAHGIDTAQCTREEFPDTITNNQRVTDQPVTFVRKSVASIEKPVKSSCRYHVIAVGVVQHTRPLNLVRCDCMGCILNRNAPICGGRHSLVTMPMLAKQRHRTIAVVFPAKAHQMRIRYTGEPENADETSNYRKSKFTHYYFPHSIYPCGQSSDQPGQPLLTQADQKKQDMCQSEKRAVFRRFYASFQMRTPPGILSL